MEKINRRDFLKLSALLTGTFVFGRDNGSRQIGQPGCTDSPFKKWDVEPGVVGFEAGSGQVLTAQDGSSLSIYSETRMRGGDKMYLLSAQPGVNLREVREELGWGPLKCGKVEVLAKDGVVSQIRYGDKIWP